MSNHYDFLKILIHKLQHDGVLKTQMTFRQMLFSIIKEAQEKISTIDFIAIGMSLSMIIALTVRQ